MTVSIENALTVAEGDDTTTEWSFQFKMTAANTLLLYLVTDYETDDAVVTPLTVGIDYTSSGGLEENSGLVNYPLVGNPLATGDALLITRETPILQDTDITSGARFYPEVHEQVWDKLILILQENRGRLETIENRVGTIESTVDGCCPPEVGYAAPFVSDAERITWNSGGATAHTHSNKAALDTITDTGILAWNQTATIVKSDGDGTGFLANDGTYKTGVPGGSGIAQPTVPPTAAGVLVGYKDATGTQAADPTQDLSTPTPTLGIDDYDITASAGALVIGNPSGGIVRVLAAGGAEYIEIDTSDSAELKVAAVGAPLHISSDTPDPGNLFGALNSVSMDGFWMPPGADAVGGTAVQSSNSRPPQGVFDVNSAANPGLAFGGVIVA